MTGERVVRRLAAILAADVAGYSRLMGRDENGTLTRLKAHRTERLEPTLARHGGRLVKFTGDGALVEFPSAVDALTAAIEFQHSMAKSNRSQPNDTAIVFRIGLHLGDLIVDGDDLYGDGVNVAARLEAEAPAGGIMISGDVHNAVVGRLNASFEDLGDLSLKNIERLVRAYRVQVDGTVASSTITPLPAAQASLALPDKPSIAVLPFQNMSGEADQEYFVDGLVEDIITALSRISWFFVIARNSSFTYKGRSVDIRDVGRELGVRYVVEGSVRRARDRLRITAQLIDAGTGNHVWADRYDGAVEDVFDLQDRITSSIVGTLEPKVQQAEIKRAQAKPTTDLTAYDLYLRALALRAEYKEEKHREALALLERAVTLDSRFSSAHALIANIYQNFKTQNVGPVEDAEAKGLAAASLALETGSDDPLALTRAGMALSVLASRHQDALAYIDRALALNRNLALAWRCRGWVYCFLGKLDEAIKDFEDARRYSPVDTAAFDGYLGTAFAYFFLGQYETALVWAEKAVREQPRWPTAHWANISAAAMVGRSQDYLSRAIAKLRQLEPATSICSVMRRMPVTEKVMQETLVAALRRAGIPERIL